MKYLFIGGPWDGRWHHTDGSPAWRVPSETREDPFRFGSMDVVLYHRQRALVPGWLVPLTFYTTDPVLPPDRGTMLPGHVQGVRGESELCSAWRYVDLNDPLHYLHVAARSWNRKGWWTR